MNTFALRAQPLRAAAILRQPLFRQRFVQASILSRTQPFHTSRPLQRTKGDDHSAHTISQRLRNLKRIPPELIPLGVVILFAVCAAIFAMGRKLVTDKTLRLSKSSPRKQPEASH